MNYRKLHRLVIVRISLTVWLRLPLPIGGAIMPDLNVVFTCKVLAVIHMLIPTDIRYEDQQGTIFCLQC